MATYKLDPNETSRARTREEWVRLYHGTGPREAEQIRQTGLKPSTRRGFCYVQTLTDNEDFARNHAGPIGEVMAFDVPKSYADKHLEGEQYLDTDATHYTIRKTLPAKYLRNAEQ